MDTNKNCKTNIPHSELVKNVQERIEYLEANDPDNPELDKHKLSLSKLLKLCDTNCNDYLHCSLLDSSSKACV